MSYHHTISLYENEYRHGTHCVSKLILFANHCIVLLCNEFIWVLSPTLLICRFIPSPVCITEGRCRVAIPKARRLALDFGSVLDEIPQFVCNLSSRCGPLLHELFEDFFPIIFFHFHSTAYELQFVFQHLYGGCKADRGAIFECSSIGLNYGRLELCSGSWGSYPGFGEIALLSRRRPELGLFFADWTCHNFFCLLTKIHSRCWTHRITPFRAPGQ